MNRIERRIISEESGVMKRKAECGKEKNGNLMSKTHTEYRVKGNS